MWILGTISENMPNYLKALKIHLFPTYMSACGWIFTCFFKAMTEDSVDMRINSLLLMRYSSLHYFVVENGYFSFKKTDLCLTLGSPTRWRHPSAGSFRILLWRAMECKHWHLESRGQWVPWNTLRRTGQHLTTKLHPAQNFNSAKESLFNIQLDLIFKFLNFNF